MNTYLIRNAKIVNEGAVFEGDILIENEIIKEIAEKIAEVTQNKGVYSVVGGGDTVAAINKLGLMDKFSFVSTGGGAMLQFLAEGTLPGTEALK